MDVFYYIGAAISIAIIVTVLYFVAKAILRACGVTIDLERLGRLTRRAVRGR
jgi:hypothetical protein